VSQLKSGGRECVFGRNDSGFGGWNISKQELNARAAVAPWTLHDLRRTVATRMAELGIQPHIIEAVLNHVSGHKGGIAGVYNRATYDREKREALSLWAEHVTALIEGRKPVIVPMKRRDS
jgi:integrase